MDRTKRRAGASEPPPWTTAPPRPTDRRRNRIRPKTAGPPAPQAGGILTVDLGGDRSQLARARPPRHALGMRGRDQGRRLWLRHRAGRGPPGAGRLQDVFRRRSGRGAARARGGGGADDLCAQRPAAGHRRGLCRAARAAGDRQHGRTGRMGRLLRRQRLAWRRRAACRHRHEPARHLGQRGGGAGAAHPLGKSRHHAADEPPRLLGSARASAQRAPDPAVPRSAPALSRHPLLARQFVRHLPRQRRALRHGAPGRRAVRRQSDARPEQSDAAGGRLAGAHRAGAQRAEGRDRRL